MHSKSDLGNGCKILDWNYTHLGSLSYDDAIEYAQSQNRPQPISCFDKENNYFHYDLEPESSIVQDVSSH